MKQNLVETFNKKYKTEIGIDKEEVDVLSKKIGDEGLKILCSIKFKKLEQLLLEDNEIANLDIMKTNNFGNKLKAMDFSTNKLKSIDILPKLNFPLLEHLFLNNNQIASIDILAQVKFPNLKELNLASNQISSIDILEKVNFPTLKELDLSKNQIVNINVFGRTKFPELNNLFLDQNKINSIDILAKVNCSKLNKLKLDRNDLKSIVILEKINFAKLNYFSIGDETLGDNVSSLLKLKCPELEDIYLYLNDSIDRESDKIDSIIKHFEDKGVTFNFISCDDDNGDINLGDDDDNFGGNDNKNNTDGFEDLLDAF